MRKRSSLLLEEHSVDAINLTPLIDVVFVVLIMFILIAPLLETEHIELAPASQKEQATTPRESMIVIAVSADDQVSVNHRNVSLYDLPMVLAELRKTHPNATPHLYQDRRGSFGMYQTVKNRLEESGFVSVDVVLTSPES